MKSLVMVAFKEVIGVLKWTHFVKANVAEVLRNQIKLNFGDISDYFKYIQLSFQVLIIFEFHSCKYRVLVGMRLMIVQSYKVANESVHTQGLVLDGLLDEDAQSLVIFINLKHNPVFVYSSLYQKDLLVANDDLMCKFFFIQFGKNISVVCLNLIFVLLLCTRFYNF